MGEQTARAPRQQLRKIHFRLAHRAYACGVGRRWWSQTISSTTSRDLVTCCTCIRILAGREAAPQQFRYVDDPNGKVTLTTLHPYNNRRVRVEMVTPGTRPGNRGWWS